MRVYVCGQLAIELESEILRERDFPARQGRLLWVYLVTHRSRPVDRSTLADAIWPDELPDSWDDTLSSVASRLRASIKKVDPSGTHIGLRGERGRIQLDLPPDVFIDTERARSGLHSAEASLRAGAIDMALAEARVAMEIAARGFMEGEHAPWIEGLRTSLESARIRAWECTIKAELLRERFELALEESDQLLLVDPLNENAYRCAMQAHAALGNSAGVARIMKQCIQVLDRAAGLSPSKATFATFENLRSGSTRTTRKDRVK